MVFSNLIFSTGKSKKKEKCKNSHLYPLIETQYCPCDKYNAQPVGNWSDCILPEGKAEVLLGMKVQGDIKECGQGYRYQAMACYDQNGRLVETSRCNSHGSPVFPHCWTFVIFGVEMHMFQNGGKWKFTEVSSTLNIRGTTTLYVYHLYITGHSVALVSLSRSWQPSPKAGGQGSLAVQCLVIQSCPTLCNHMDCSPPGFSVHEILQARVLEWAAMPSSKGSCQPRDWT